MPRQYVVCGRPVPRLGTRHISLLLVSLAVFAVFSLLFTLPGTAVPARQRLQAAGNRLSIPKSLKSPWMNRLNPFRPPSHAPARQKNDTDGESVWYADWSWLLMPFSSSVTLDENRALLPVLPERTPVYCYYDETANRDPAVKDAASDLLLVWRRAWWAQGFRPIILGPAEAMNNPLYEEVQKLRGLKASFELDLMRWLAWDTMGDGLLANHLLFPMGPHDDPLLTFLRRGEFPKLTRFNRLQSGLFIGPKNEVSAVIKAAIASPRIDQAEEVLDAVEFDKKESPFAVDDAPKALAYYSLRDLAAFYIKVSKTMLSSPAAGLRSLTQLVTSHLHLTWQNTFPDGIAVVKPLPHHTTHLITPAYDLALRLAHCPESPIPGSCPPNRLQCRPCDDTKPMKISTPSSYANKSTLYTIGTVPHPYTSSMLNSLRSELSIPWIRRESQRDAWITSLTSSLFSESVSTTPRLRRFKEAVAATPDTAPGGGAARSLWLTAEQALPEDLDYHFGFALPDAATYADQQQPQQPQQQKQKQQEQQEEEEQTGGGSSSSTPSRAGHKNNIIKPTPPLHSPQDGPIPTDDELALEPELFALAQTVVLTGSKAKPASIPSSHYSSSSSSSSTPNKSPSSSRLTANKGQKPEDKEKKNKNKKKKATKEDLALRDAVEAWNLADTEAWRFARAYLARKTVERRAWEEEEARYAGGLGSESRARKHSGGGGRRGGAQRVWDRWLDRD
ncbi:uncharacterized protein THITE_2123053 [Thermothielavioides terrestris NRRL 8126]|uniref:Uncharacterized protein n=1 Tax=Thermothielavioides terrestris (strain ATCC 38088 / NRRL 8126) TaxID=578455 RepID=G2RGN5_THETT|nr:uncharacterized protein THITE_2123053 [Thermothielavioides terrestris NRRL 8126]AEO71067.1 hypothetical protein THITE_2123053 [Thermothielavioides terrestris NRRL 8126]